MLRLAKLDSDYDVIWNAMTIFHDYSIVDDNLTQTNYQKNQRRMNRRVVNATNLCAVSQFSNQNINSLRRFLPEL